jgi:hypothetical protein
MRYEFVDLIHLMLKLLGINQANQQRVLIKNKIEERILKGKELKNEKIVVLFIH